MKSAIMQPYFLPYIGYWQLINCVDEFIVYDNIEYTKKGWINRNRYLFNNEDKLFTIPLKKSSDFELIENKFLADDHLKSITKLLRQIESSYKKAPYFEENYELIKSIFLFENNNLFEYIYNSIKLIVEFLEIKTKIIRSSTLSSDLPDYKGRDKIIHLLEKINSNSYINSIGGQKLYSKERFAKDGITLNFLESTLQEYKQYNTEFVSGLSIIDHLMFRSKEEIINSLNEYKII
ncbi:hypothetical protein GCM10011344_31160 [Dokdonia pacifica]|uniref:WbqC-like protein family protein n=1 Tax=Dokdonia pacifica TaxID=1627892 RepID=A0A239BPT3_9FLAO|nr:WbqC family protein [Dokdonia pacifica]GGG28138.1 hypothetical protein GCM10011344_31160 [Dokdonia pacifica]SNS10010.1 WbqC-like protein family protein [Dokdonia pacifica]